MSEFFRKGKVWLPTAVTMAFYAISSMMISLVGQCQEATIWERMQTWHWPQWTAFWGTPIIASFPTIKAFLDPIVQETKKEEEQTAMFRKTAT